MTPSASPSETASGGLTTPVIATTRTNMTVQARTIASTNACEWAGSWRLRCENESVTTVLETNPPSTPVSPMPCSLPSTFTSTYPTKFRPAISTTINQIL